MCALGTPGCALVFRDPGSYGHNPLLSAQMTTSKPTLVALRSERDKTIDVLSDAFSTDLIDVDEYERRVDLAHRAKTCDALVLLRRDVEPAQDNENEAVGASSSQALATTRPRTRTVLAIMGGAERKGEWRVPENLRVSTLMGGVQLDFREAVFAAGISKVKILACMGGVEIIVPPGLAVECGGTGIMGGFESLDRYSGGADPDQPLLQIGGLAVMGGVEISTRLPGESARQAKKRRKRERKSLPAKKTKQLPK